MCARSPSASVLLANEGSELAVRSGGHSGAGHGVTDGGIVLDLRDMKALDIDVDGRTAWAETGLTAGGYSTAVGVHGLRQGSVTPAPSVSVDLPWAAGSAISCASTG